MATERNKRRLKRKRPVVIATLGILLAGLLLVLASARALNDPAPNPRPGHPDALNALLFGLCLASVLAHHVKKRREAREREFEE